MKIALFGGSFDPVHSEHIALIEAAKEGLGLDKVIVIPSHKAPHKAFGAVAGDADRLHMLEAALAPLPYAEASDCELTAGGTSYTYLTCRAFRARYPSAELCFLVGADMLEDFFTWKNPDDIVANVTLVACGRGNERVAPLHARFRERFGKDFLELPYTGKDVSSREIRVALAFGKHPAALPPAVAEYIGAHGLYTYSTVPVALALEKEERREHSYRVALMATARARTLKLSESKALLAAALHDCGKYVPLSSPLLRGFSLGEEVPAPVVHQYTGAYLAEHEFGISDGEILDAIKFHASGRAQMPPLSVLIYLADLLEEGRTFDGVESLRTLFWRDLDACLLASLEHQLEYLKGTGKPVYSLTEEAYHWIKGII